LVGWLSLTNLTNLKKKKFFFSGKHATHECMVSMLHRLTRYLRNHPDVLQKMSPESGDRTYKLRISFIKHFRATGAGSRALTKKEQAKSVKTTLRKAGCVLHSSSSSSNVLGPGATWILSEELHTMMMIVRNAQIIVISDSDEAADDTESDDAHEAADDTESDEAPGGN
jgi:hypothetical protein